MFGIAGIGNANELQVTRPIKGARNLPAEPTSATNRDGVEISSEAQVAVEVSQFLRESEKVQEIRQERVEAAKEQLEQGRHRVEEVVNAVAEALIGRL
jgi:anti-sigma28 factor (negative regulator of flagellin synthesis)